MDARLVFPPLLFVFVSFGGCSPPSGGYVVVRSDTITTTEAQLLDFTFGAEAVVANDAPTRAAIVSQLRYAQGILRKGNGASGQVGNVALSDVTETSLGDKKRVAYKASLVVAWPKDSSPPTTYALALPLDTIGLDAFNEKYDGLCGKSEGERRDFWHDFNPAAQGCTVDDADVSRATATVTARTKAADKYPEYDRIWEDDRLDVVALFGIIRANESGDWGYQEAQRFVDEASRRLDGASITKNGTSSSLLEDRTITGKITVSGRARDVQVDAIVIDAVETVGADFDPRYDALTEKADLLLYSGHARHGRNIHALVRKGKVPAGKYQLVLLNGCESFSAVDTTLSDRRREANGAADPSGTKFLDVVSNAQPAQASDLANVSNVLYATVLERDTPLSYTGMIAKMPENQVVVVYGEEDNTFAP